MIDIRHGDCVEVMATLPDRSVDVVFADPPYNTGTATDKTPGYTISGALKRQNWTAFHADWDVIEDNRAFSLAWLGQVKRLLKPKGTVFICGTFHNIPDVALALRLLGFYTIQWIAWCIPNAFPNRMMKKMINANQTIIWARAGESHYYDSETAKLINGGKNLRDYWVIQNDCVAGRTWKHPSKKPAAVVKRALQIAAPKEPGTLILDPFGGSGTTGVAAHTLGLDCLLIDRETAYVEMMKKRLAVDESSLFVMRGEHT